MKHLSRIEAARQRAAHTKRRFAVFAAAGFAAIFGLAAASHGGTSASTDNTSAVDKPPATDTSTFDFGTADVAPSEDLAPQVRTRAS